MDEKNEFAFLQQAGVPREHQIGWNPSHFLRLIVLTGRFTIE